LQVIDSGGGVGSDLLGFALPDESIIL